MTRRITTTIGTLQKISENIEKLIPPDLDAGGINESRIKKIVQAEVSKQIKDTFIDEQGKPTVLLQSLFDIFKQQLPAQQSGSLTVDIDDMIMGWLLFNFFSLVKEHDSQGEISGIADQFANKFPGDIGQVLMHQPHSAFFGDTDAFVKVIKVVNTFAPILRSAFDAAQKQTGASED